MKLLNFNIIKLTLCLVIGISIGYHYHLSYTIAILLTLVLFSAMLFFFLKHQKQFKKTIWFGLISFATMISIGVLITTLHNPKNNLNHYSKFISKNDTISNTILFRIESVLKSNNYYDKYIVHIININNKTSSGKLLLNVEKNRDLGTLNIDNVYSTKSILKAIPAALNPNPFNYKNYLARQYIYHQFFTTEASLLKISFQSWTLFGATNKIKKYINKKLKPYSFKPNETAIINALLLGEKQDLSDVILKSYSNAGAIHILAISGLHIGILLLILNFLLKPIENLKRGKQIKGITLVSLLWCFAVLAGLSASVTRAVTMFSIVAITMHLKRPTNIYNTLAISMFVILMFKPLFLFDVGFQLSYLAVFSIVTLSPRLEKLYKSKNWILNKAWQIVTVTLSAQLGVIPISLYYFHQFPSLFLLSNLVIIPVLGFILGFGILVIILAACNLLPNYISDIYGFIITLMNRFVMGVSKQDAFLFKDISFNMLNVISTYIFLAILFKLVNNWNFKNIRLFLITVLGIQMMILYNNYKAKSNTFIVFHKNKHTILGFVNNEKLTVGYNLKDSVITKDQVIKNFMIGNAIKDHNNETIKPLYQINGKFLLVVDRLGFYNIAQLEPYYVLLRESPKINLNRLIDSLQPKQIIADGSNYKSYMKRWKTICEKRKLPFHQTNEKGAYILDY